jgi:hypothetical protein
MLSFTEMRAAEAVKEYDADLMLGQRKDTGDWCVFLPGNRANGMQPYPVFSFGRELPHPDDIKKKLYQNDVRRNGQQILDQLDRIYEDEQKKIADKADEGVEAYAEAILSNMHQRGTNPFPRVFVAPKYGGGRVRSSG